MPERSLSDRGIRVFLIGVGILTATAVLHTFLDVTLLPSLLFFPGIALVIVGLLMYAYSNWKRSQTEVPLGKKLKPRQ